MPDAPRWLRRPFLPVLAAVLVLGACDSGTGPPDPPDGPAPVASVTLSLDSLRVLVQEQRSLTATTRDARGGTLSGRPLTWTSSNPAVATVDAAGTVRAVSLGRTVVSAASEGVRAEAAVQVFDVDLKDNAIEADSVFILTSTLAEVQNGLLRYQDKGSGRTVKTGDVLVGAKPGGGGYLRKVTSVTQAAGVITAQTEPTTFDQLVDTADIEIVIEETLQTALQRDYAAGRLRDLDLPEGVSVNADGSLALNQLQLNFDFNESGNVGCCAAVSARLSGNFAFLMGGEIYAGNDPFTFQLRTGAFGVPNFFHFETIAAVDLDVTATASVTGSLGDGWTRSKELFRRQIYPPLPTPCAWKGPICYSLSAVIEAYTTVTAGATASVSQHYQTRQGATLGVVWSRGQGWQHINFPISSSSSDPPVVSLEGNLGVRVGLRPRLEFDVYEGLAGVSAGIDGGVEAGITANLWEWSAEAALFVDVFAEAELSFWGLVNESTEIRYPNLARYVIATHGGPMVRLQVTPDPVTVPVGGTRQATARAISLITGTDIGIAPTVDWEVEVPGIVSIEQNGVLTGVSPGTSRFKATIRGTGIVSDNPYPVVTVQAEQQLPTLKVGTCVTFDRAGCGESRPLLPGESFGILLGADHPETHAALCGAQIDVRDPFAGSTRTYTTAAPSCLVVHDVTVPAGAASGSYTFVVGPARLSGFQDGPAVNLTVDVASVQVALSIGACLSADATYCEVDQNRALAPGESFYVLFGADDPGTHRAQCGATIDVTDAFTGATTVYTTPAPNCLGAHVANVPLGASSGTYTFVVGPARLAGFLDGPAVQLGIRVQGGSGGTTPQVVGITPSGGGVALDAAVSVTFSEPMSLASLQSALTVTASGDGGPTAVPGSVTLDGGGTVATFTPSAPLREFGTEHVVGIGTGARDAQGEALAAAVQQSFSTVVVSGEYYYRILNVSTGGALDTPEIGGLKTCEMREPGPYTGQYWYFTPSSGSYSHARNAYGGDAEYLEAAAAPDRCFLTGGGDYSGQQWEFTPVGAGLQNMYLNSASHGATNRLGLFNGQPVMVPPTPGTDQVWRFERIQAR